jgi:hypothetical protein
MADLKVQLTLTSKDRLLVRNGEPVVLGVPLARASFTKQKKLELTDSCGNRVPCDVTVLDHWPDESARWALLAFCARTGGEHARFGLRLTDDRGDEQTVSESPKLQIENGDRGYTISTGPLRLTLGDGEGWPVRQVTDPRGADWLSPAHSGLQFKLEDGTTAICNVHTIHFESTGSVRASAVCHGTASLKAGKRLEVIWRLEFFAGLPIVIVHLTIRNPHRAVHPGGYWELGDSGSVLLREAAFRLSVRNAVKGANAFCSPEPDLEQLPVTLPFEIYQDSSGGENWRSRNHVNRAGQLPMNLQGYRFTEVMQHKGNRSTPIASVESACGMLSLASRHFWQNFPKALEISESEISLSLFPRQWNDLHELQGGEQKTHTFAISFGHDGITEVPLEWFRQPLIPAFDPEWIAETEAVTYLTPTENDSSSPYQTLVNLAIAGDDTFEHKREKIDEYGWRNFGDLYADHETVFAEDPGGPGPLISHYNNQYDPIAGFCYQWLRSGDPKWWSQFNELAAHVVDIDIYHTDEDKAAYNHGLFWHTVHYIDAGRSTHRSYPKAGQSMGGGPSNEHVYTTGLMMHYFLTGSIASLEAAIELANFVIDIDDGSKTVFRWLAKGSTGLASASRTLDYHGPGRGAGNALSALIDGHRLTRDSVFLNKGEELIRRVCHPDEDIARLTLLDAENRWFYTMFLQALGKYLDYKADLGQVDAMYGYARAVLLHYARWMAVNEYAFLEKPEILDYPTETWAAQDMRKSEVFRFAWLHSSEKERERFAERASFFFEKSLGTLLQMKTRSLCRPLVLLLSFGWKEAWFRTHHDAGRPTAGNPPSTRPAQKRFVPQKTKALGRAKLMLGAGAIALVLLAIAVSIALSRI